MARLRTNDPRIRGPHASVDLILRILSSTRIGEFQVVDCVRSRPDSLPSFTIYLYELPFVLEPEDYVTTPAHGSHRCQVLFEENEDPESQDWILGIPFIEKFPFALDYADKKILIFKNKISNS
jgi:Eukaryotic aspartyl protease